MQSFRRAYSIPGRDEGGSALTARVYSLHSKWSKKARRTHKKPYGKCLGKTDNRKTIWKKWRKKEKIKRGRRKSKWKCCFIYTNWVPNNKVTWGSTGYGEWFKSKGVGTSLAVPWLRLCLPMEADQVWPLVGELRSHTPHPRKKKKQNVKQKQYCNQFKKD